ncbi:hypothetical protein FDZ59_04090 [Ehrlichia ruminantium]|nr:hypothetical protein FDZ59_04090 [Ehrlichia ruminantium]
MCVRRLLRALFSILQGAFYYAVSVTSNNLTNQQNDTTGHTSSGYNLSSTVSTSLSPVYNITRVSSTSSSSLSTLSPTTIITNSSVGDPTDGQDPLIAYITYFVFFGVPILVVFMICLAVCTSVSNTNQPPRPRPVRHFLAPVLFFDDDNDSGCGSSISQSIVSSDTSNNGSVAEESDDALSNVSGAAGENDLEQQGEEENAVIAGGVFQDNILNISQESCYDNIPVEGACGVAENMCLKASSEDMSELQDISVVSFNGHNITETIV